MKFGVNVIFSLFEILTTAIALKVTGCCNSIAVHDELYSDLHSFFRVEPIERLIAAVRRLPARKRL